MYTYIGIGNRLGVARARKQRNWAISARLKIVILYELVCIAVALAQAAGGSASTVVRGGAL